MCNDGPGGAEGWLVPPAGVERAGGANGPIERLRARIRALERVPVSLAFPPAPGTPGPACSSSPWQAEDRDAIGAPHPLTIVPDLALRKGDEGRKQREPPLGKLKRSGLHEIKPAAYHDAPAALAFAFAAISWNLVPQNAAPGLVLWCLTERAAREWGRPYAPGLWGSASTLPSFSSCEARHAQDAAWALEEGLKSRALVAALGQIEMKTPLMARRLDLAAKAGHTPCLLLSDHQGTGLPGTGLAWHAHPLARRSSSEVVPPASMLARWAHPVGISPWSAAGGWHLRKAGPWSGVMRRMISVWLPYWPIERLKREREASRGTPVPDSPHRTIDPSRWSVTRARGLVLTAVNAQQP